MLESTRSRCFDSLIGSATPLMDSERINFFIQAYLALPARSE
jgi:hypothetical protein